VALAYSTAERSGFSTKAKQMHKMVAGKGGKKKKKKKKTRQADTIESGDESANAVLVACVVASRKLISSVILFKGI
jgi:putative NIF3 family GTP cyclohydrolase 1 type 2